MLQSWAHTHNLSLQFDTLFSPKDCPKATFFRILACYVSPETLSHCRVKKCPSPGVFCIMSTILFRVANKASMVLVGLMIVYN